MSLVGYIAYVVFTLVLAIVVKWYDSDMTAQFARQTGVSGWTGWAALVIALLWLFLPVLAGANTGDGELWVVGAALAGGGVFCCTIALTSVDEHRLLTDADHREPAATSVGVEPSVTATADSPDEEGRTPIFGLPSVYTDWIVQRRMRIGRRRNWKTVAGGVEQTPFTLGDGAVSVDGDRYRVFSAAEKLASFDPDEPLPEPVAAFFETHGDLPQPTERSKRMQVIESYMPADEPVTVVGTPKQGPRPGTVAIDGAPPDTVIGGGGSSADQSTGEPILIRGEYDEATTRIRRRVYWFGIAGVILAVGGQALAFWLSSASLVALI